MSTNNDELLYDEDDSDNRQLENLSRIIFPKN